MNVNHLAVIVAGLVGFFFGGLWYSPKLFGRIWGREAGMLCDPAAPPAPGAKKGSHPAKAFAFGIVFSLIAAYAFANWIGPAPSLESALKQAAIVGACFVGTSFGINYQFANRSTLMWLIDAGYHLAQFLLFGLVLGLWH